MTRSITVAVGIAVGAGCVDPRPASYVLCHNANCAYSDPARDDTLAALRDSLAVVDDDGRTLFDGMEIDLIWDTDHARCAFEHDLGDAGTGDDAGVIADELAAFFRARRERATWNGERFIVKYDLKYGAGPYGGLMSPVMMRSLTGCALAMTATLESAAADGGIELVSLFSSDDVRLLLTLVASDAWKSAPSGRGTARQLSTSYNVDPTSELRPQIGVMSIKWSALHDGNFSVFQALAEQGVDTCVWMYDANVEALGALQRLAPAYINTNEARFMRSWLDPD